MHEVTIPLSTFLAGIHDYSAQRKRDAAHVAILAREVRGFLSDADPEDATIKSLLESADAAERVALRLYSERPLSLKELIHQPGVPTGVSNERL